MYRGKALEKLSSPDQLDYLLPITRPQSWLLLLAFVGVMLAVVLWSIFGSLTTSVEAQGWLVNAGDSAASESLQAIVYVPLQQAQQIRAGMQAQLSPSTLAPEEHGYLRGQVLSVNAYESSEDDMLAALGNPTTVERLLAADRLFEVRVDLLTDEQGYVWTTSERPAFEVGEAAIPASVIFIIREERPITRVFPGLAAQTP